MVRIKNRYLLVNILYPELDRSGTDSNLPDVVTFNGPTTDALNSQALLRAIRLEVSMLFGDYGAGATSDSLAVKYLSSATSTFILRVARAHYQLVWAALSLMTSVPVKDGRPCVFRIVRVSGTIRKAEEEAIRRAREMILKARRSMDAKDSTALDNIFGGGTEKATVTRTSDALVVDGSDSDNEEAYSSEGTG